MNTCTKASASSKQEVEENYTKMLAASMQRTKDTLTRNLIFNSGFRQFRPKKDNPYIHGALNAIHEIT